MKHIISALVENKPGVLAHVAGMFAARAFNIDEMAEKMVALFKKKEIS